MQPRKVIACGFQAPNAEEDYKVSSKPETAYRKEESNMDNSIVYTPQSHRSNKYTLLFSNSDLLSEFGNKRQVQGVDLLLQVDGNHHVVKIDEGGEYSLIAVKYDGIVTIEGEGHQFLAYQSSWSGGGSYEGAVALKPGARLVLDQKGSKRYYTCQADGSIVFSDHDATRLEDPRQWKKL